MTTDWTDGDWHEFEVTRLLVDAEVKFLRATGHAFTELEERRERLCISTQIHLGRRLSGDERDYVNESVDDGLDAEALAESIRMADRLAASAAGVISDGVG